MAVDFADERIGLGAQAVPGDAAGGRDVRGEPAFEALEAEVRRVDSDGAAAVRWPEIVAGGTKILVNDSKDILVGAWVAYGLARLEGFRGLAVGLGLLDGMARAHWDGLFPPKRRERGRVGALDWLFERLAALFAGRTPEPSEEPAVIAAAESLRSLVEFAEAQLTSATVAAGDLLKVMRPLAQAAQRAAEARAQAERSAAEGAARAAEGAAAQGTDGAARPAAVQPPAAGGAGAPAADQSGRGEAARAAPPPRIDVAAPAPIAGAPAASLGPLESAMRQFAAALREADATDPRSYVLVRTAGWLPVQQLPAQTDGVTLLNPPSDERRGGIDAQIAAGKHREALTALEATLAAAVFWLDGQRLAAECLAALGPAYQRAHGAVTAVVASFVRRFPAVLDLAFASGEPFAGPATRRWLEEIAGLGGGTAAAAESEGVASAAVAEATALASGGRARDAIALLGRGIRGTASGRERFVLRLAQGEIGLDHDMAGMTLALAAELAEEAEARALEDWEPDLAARGSELWLKALAHPAAKTMAPDRHRAAVDAARARLVRTDAARVARYLT